MASAHVSSAIPVVSDAAADVRFRRTAAELGLNPDDRWLGGYVEYEWHHSRHVFEGLPGGVAGANVLEFGCNVGATSIVLTHLGASVTAVDVDEAYLRLAKANAARYDIEDRIRFLHCADTTRLPFDDAAFSLITCNSVLEYVPHAIISAVRRELDRVLRPGGVILVIGTASRLAIREVHSRRWLVNYLPRSVERILGAEEFQRGIWPWQVSRGFGAAYENLDLADGGRAYFEARRQWGMPAAKLALLRAVHRFVRPFGASVGLLTPSISVALRKRMSRGSER